MKKSFLLLIISLFSFHTATFAQQKTPKKINIKSLASKKAKPKTARDSSLLLNRKIPRKAALWSLIPGGGQVYNGQIWKAPIFAGSIVGLSIYALKRRSDYNKHYDTYNTLLLTSFNNPTLATQMQTARADKVRALRDWFGTGIQQTILENPYSIWWLCRCCWLHELQLHSPQSLSRRIFSS